MNIYQIEEDLLSIFDEIEELGGELTPEIEEKLAITQEQFNDKVESYTNYIKSLKVDMQAIEAEQKRLKDVYERKERTLNRINEIVVKAIEEFGETKKTGVKYIDFGTGYVSIRKTIAVDDNKELIKDLGLNLYDIISYAQAQNQLNCVDHFDLNELVEFYNKSTESNITIQDVKPVDVNFDLSISMADLEKPEIYHIISEIAKQAKWKLSTSLSKTAVKPSLEENGSCMPNLAKLKENKSLIIK